MSNSEAGPPSAKAIARSPEQSPQPKLVGCWVRSSGWCRPRGLQAAGQPPLGPVNGLIDWLERHHPSALYDVISASNRYERRIPGDSAHRGYDLATGVGVPRFARIVGLVPKPGQ